ncbi:MAG: tripartite tricarboxylate transporter substrate binding protein BugD [Hydrogenophaga sp.]|uniref:tripartite tricarboxylate transporter substrate-binding protein n=1 Tax=Hydrogenophaga sp. TaxID=1904254 RepID=UPI001697CA37|nr:tripartite tricarboxylate transporter substrate-binding protein [Hydrogenophaga sp.]NIM40461.1 tripartite tricarboxylate transporter substrate binding protein BugD [Hydrogenophaga sp.]NIN25879.1 tripartite tricarboxylate transporter substrate binding protein BugD [Hydrogenophaga sp.]NIN30751.1 tripartite tricarboxylate transporter substrate binding protein BugD [Hydrogenophaga sp.]NIN54844.1 tripartite tricarboxylate transporter substrate binding protein BugD [Hydrogenophaga sp.]NIO50884.1 
MKQLFTLALGATLAAGAFAQAFPSKPVTFVVPFAAGGPTDLVARQLAEAMRKPLGDNANIVVENTAGAGGTIAATRVARAPKDGYTLLVWHIGMAATDSLYKKKQFNALEDFEYLGAINDVPMTLLGSNKLNANTYRDFEAYIRANGGKLNMAHAGLGSASHICGLMWQHAMKLDKSMTTIAYRGTGPAMNDLIGGQVDVMCDQTTNTTSQIEGGRVKAFAVTTAKPLSSHPTLKHYPSLQEMGLKDFNLTIWHGMYAPKGTPPDVLKKLNDALKVALKDPKFIKSQEELGAIVVNDNRVTPEGHKKFVANEIAKLKVVIDAAGQYAD